MQDQASSASSIAMNSDTPNQHTKSYDLTWDLYQSTLERMNAPHFFDPKGANVPAQSPGVFPVVPLQAPIFLAEKWEA